MLGNTTRCPRSDEFKVVGDYSRSLIYALVCDETAALIFEETSFVTSKGCDDVCQEEDRETAVVGRNRNKLFLWQILFQEFLHGPGGEFTGMLPVSELPPPVLEQSLKMHHACMHDMFNFVKKLPVSILDGSDMGISPFSKVSIEGLKSRMDWSLSTVDPSQRTEMIARMCASGRYIMKKRDPDNTSLDIIMQELSEYVCDFDTAIDLFASVEDMAGDHPDTKHNTCSDREDSIGVDASIQKHIMMVENLNKTSQQKNDGNQRVVSDISSSLDLINGNLPARWEHISFALPIEWIQVMEQCVRASSTLIDWNYVSSDASRISLSRVDFAACDDALCFLDKEGERTTGTSVENALILKECARICSAIIHHGIHNASRNVAPSLVHLEMLRPTIDGVSNEATKLGKHPKLEVVKNTIVTYATLSPGIKHLIFIDKSSWNDLYSSLSEVNISVLELSWPFHREYFAGNMNGQGIWVDFDCIFLSTDEDTQQIIQYKANQEFFKLFQRVIMFESDPICVGRMNQMLQDVHRDGISICFIRPDMSEISLKLGFRERKIQRESVPDEIVPNECDPLQGLYMKGSHVSFAPENDGHLELHHYKNQGCDILNRQQTSLGEASFVSNARNPTWMGPSSPFPSCRSLPREPEQQWQQSYKENIDTASPLYDIPYDRIAAQNGFETCPSFGGAPVFDHCLPWHPEIDSFDGVPANRPGYQGGMTGLQHFETQNPFHMRSTPPARRATQPGSSPIEMLSPPLRHQQMGPMKYCIPDNGMYGAYSPQVQSQVSSPFWNPLLSPSPFVGVQENPGVNQSPTATTVLMPAKFWPQPMDIIQSYRHIEKMYDEMRTGRPAKRRLRRGEKFKRFK